MAAAGAGRRMRIDRPKQLLELHDTPILIYSIRKFDRCKAVSDVIVAAPRESVAEVREMIRAAGFVKPVTVVEGGARRQDSVAAALRTLSPDTKIVAVHDAVRPLVRVSDIEAAIKQAEIHGAAILGIPIVDTVKKAERDFVDSTLAREHLVLVQTPQVFRTEVLREAFERAERDGYYGTDESSLVERIGRPVFIVRGSDRNIKITRPSDLPLARMFLEEEEAEP